MLISVLNFCVISLEPFIDVKSPFTGLVLTDYAGGWLTGCKLSYKISILTYGNIYCAWKLNLYIETLFLCECTLLICETYFMYQNTLFMLTQASTFIISFSFRINAEIWWQFVYLVSCSYCTVPTCEIFMCIARKVCFSIISLNFLSLKIGILAKLK